MKSLLHVSSCLVFLAAASAFAVAPVHLDRKGEQWAASTLKRMTLEEKIGQMIMVWARVQFLNAHSREYLRLREDMRRYHVGGFGVTVPVEGGRLILGQPLEAAFLTNGLQHDSKYPLIFAADFERGLANRLVGSTGFPAAMAFGAAGDPTLAREFGRITAEESRAIGIQWNWFPVADVNSNPANPIINTRSFGEDPALVSQMVAAYIAGARQAGMLTTVKHFPGHGDTDTDSHLALARTTADRARLDSLELVPFQAAFAAGVDAVMVGHITVPAIEPDPDRPASISSKVVTGLLKDQLGFKGLVVTDALDMGALMHAFSGSEAAISGEEAVQAVLAGNDMVIIPADLAGAYNGLLRAVHQGRLSRQRIDESVLKILRMKASVGLNRTRLVDLKAIPEQVGNPENLAVADQVADRSITLVEDSPGLIPLAAGAPSASSGGVTAVLFTDDARGSEAAHSFVHELRQRAPDARIFVVDEMNAAAVSAEIVAAAQSASRVIAVAESFPSARRTVKTPAKAPGRPQGPDKSPAVANKEPEKGSAALDAGPAALLAQLVQAGAQKTIVAALGNPYTGSSIPGIQTYLCTFSNTPNSAASLVKALFGETPIHGRLPVSLPGMAQRGAGLNRDAIHTPAPQ